MFSENSGDTMVVVQLPRGNLETFHPRLLVLWSIADRIDNDNYDQAWELATANRVDLNIVVDYKWPMFLQNVDKFVRSIRREEVRRTAKYTPKLAKETLIISYTSPVRGKYQKQIVF